MVLNGSILNYFLNLQILINNIFQLKFIHILTIIQLVGSWYTTGSIWSYSTGLTCFLVMIYLPVPTPCLSLLPYQESLPGSTENKQWLRNLNFFFTTFLYILPVKLYDNNQLSCPPKTKKHIKDRACIRKNRKKKIVSLNHILSQAFRLQKQTRKLSILIICLAPHLDASQSLFASLIET